MGNYRFTSDDAFRFGSEIGARTRKKGNELQFFQCPYCRGGNNDRWTFAINLGTGQFNCKRGSCGAHGNMITLHKDFGFSLGTEVDRFFDGLAHFRNIHREKRAETKPAAIRFMESRGISEAVTVRYGITTQKDHENIIVFPFEDADGVLRFVKYRKADFDKTKDKNKEWCERDCMPILFGMRQCNPENKTLIMTEGQIDSLSVTEAGFENAVSVPTGKNGFTWVPHCWTFLKQFEKLIIFGDYERGEISLLEEMRKHFDGAVYSVRPADYIDCKDANEILMKHGKEAVRNAIRNAEPTRINELIAIEDVRRKDLSQMEVISSTIPSLDKILGGFYFGQLILLTGSRGEGKSTLANQMAAGALEQGSPVFYYSGELQDWFMQNWIFFQLAGPGHVNPMVSNLGYTSYSVDEAVRPAIARWLSGRLQLFRNESLLEDDHGTILDVAVKAVKQYGSKVLFFDNLMTAMEDDQSTDLYRQQTAFVRELASIAKRYGVLVFLIVHPRKQGVSTFSNDDVMGSSNITNLADVVIRYGRSDTEESDYSSYVQVFKNRLTGRVHRGGDYIGLYFDESSKRIAEQPDFSWRYGWDTSEDMLTEISTDEPIPF